MSPETLAGHRVDAELRSLYYVPDYVTEDVEERLLLQIRSSKAKWTQVSLDSA